MGLIRVDPIELVRAKCCIQADGVFKTQSRGLLVARRLLACLPASHEEGEEDVEDVKSCS